MAENILNEDGSRILTESGDGIFLESYVAPEDLLTADILVGDAVVTTLLRVNTPKFLTVDIGLDPPVITTGTIYSSDPDKTMSVDIVVGDVVVGFSVVPSVATPRNRYPVRHYIWVHGLRGNTVDCIA